eukprot:TRINITY_DN34159_c0_g1_i1.p1 TRINITY_DN34159_c0_g1~~TRINITY_DN34159_c0_g1_i1.p1  ORF type:complete len:493 (+),score=111.44 TRINITY_DN34159_c0_g1_i1:72-1550(+)
MPPKSRGVDPSNRAQTEAEQCKDALHCYVMLSSFEEATLGFGITLAFHGTQLVNARSPFEFLSYDAFIGTVPGGDAGAGTAVEPPFAVASLEGVSTWVCALCKFVNAASDRNAPCQRCRAAPPLEEDLRQLLSPSLTRSRPTGCRQDSFGCMRFSHWLPLYLTEEHFQRELCHRCLQAAWNRVPLEALPPNFPLDDKKVELAIWNVMPALMNSTAVAMVGGELHMSDVALRGYYNLHRLLIALATPSLRARAQEEAELFASDSNQRLKSACPNLGHFLPRLLLLPEPVQAWHRIHEVLLRETLDRTVLHAYRDFPELATETDNAEYVNKRWRSAAKGLRMLLFSVRFLGHVAQWGSCDKVAQHYAKRYGQASRAEQDFFREEVRAIKAVDSWESFAKQWLMEAEERFPPETLEDETPPAPGGQKTLAHCLAGQGLLAALKESEQHSLAKAYHCSAMAAGGKPSGWSWRIVGAAVALLASLLVFQLQRLTSGT